MANHLDTIMKGPYGEAFGQALEFMAIDTCTVYQQSTERNEFGKVRPVSRAVVKDYPCALSFGTSRVETSSPLPEAEQDITLFLDTGVRVEPGAVIVIKQGATGRTESYNMAGVPKMYDTHQEITLERTDKKSGETVYEPNTDNTGNGLS